MTERGFAKMHKKRIVSLAVILLCLSIMGTGTLAYFTDSTTAHNVITTGNIDIELIETRADGSTFENVIGVMPGAEVDKIVQVKNIGANDAWIRVAVDKEITLANGEPGDENYLMTNYNNNGTRAIYNSTDWTLKNGYFYYKNILPAGAITEPLFNNVLFKTSMGNEYQNSTAQVYVYAQATQVDNNGTTVFEAEGWPEAE